MKASECPRCGGQLDQTTDTEHVSWHVTSDECNRCMTVAYTQAKHGGATEEEALKQADSAGQLWKAAPVTNP